MPEFRFGWQHAELRFVVSVFETVLVEFHLGSKGKNCSKIKIYQVQYEGGTLPRPEFRHRHPVTTALCRDDLRQRNPRRQELNPILYQKGYVVVKTVQIEMLFIFFTQTFSRLEHSFHRFSRILVIRAHSLSAHIVSIRLNVGRRLDVVLAAQSLHRIMCVGMKCKDYKISSPHHWSKLALRKPLGRRVRLHLLSLEMSISLLETNIVLTPLLEDGVFGLPQFEHDDLNPIRVHDAALGQEPARLVHRVLVQPHEPVDGSFTDLETRQVR